jgi:dihydrofolate reductase
MGGAAVVRSCLDAGLPDRLTLHVSPQTYGAGTPLFAGSGALAAAGGDHRIRVAIHVTYDVG